VRKALCSPHLNAERENSINIQYAWQAIIGRNPLDASLMIKNDVKLSQFYRVSSEQNEVRAKTTMRKRKEVSL